MAGQIKKLIKIIVLSLFLGSAFFIIIGQAMAARVDELRQDINTHNSEIDRIEKEIEEYRETLDDLRVESDTLQSEIRRIDITRQKLSADINLTQTKINAAGLSIEKLDIEIGNNETAMAGYRRSMAEIIRQINNADRESLMEIILANDSLSSFLAQADTLIKFQDEIKETLENLRQAQTVLTQQREAKTAEQEQSNILKLRLASQRSIADENRREQSAFLVVTKNKETNYQALLTERIKRKEQLEEEIRQIEEQIRVEIDPKSLPPTGTGVLKWPLKNIKITQYFGNTTFASQNPQIYNGRGHNGIDLAASVGTPVFAALSGRVTGVDDTDRVCSGASYGRWLLIDHGNGLSTLYAHLSRIAVGEGQMVSAGQEIAYSGNTGYTTGPHLHFEVLATKAVRITDGINELKSKSCAGAVYRLPLSGFNGKLNPLSYL